MTDAAIEQLERIETIEQAYDAWDELRREHAAFRARCAEERRKIDQQGSFLVGAVRAAADQGVISGARYDTDALATRGDDELHRFLADAEEKIAKARLELEGELAAESALYDAAFVQIREEVHQRISRLVPAAPPRLRLLLRPIGQTSTLLHAERVPQDDAVLLLYALCGKVPSRYGFLFDDSTDDLTQAPPPLYADEGLSTADVRRTAPELRAYMEACHQVAPVKGFLPVFIPRPGGGEDFFRMLQRGPVMEVELLKGTEFVSILNKADGERFAGHLLRLKLSGRIRLELDAG